MGRLLLFTFRKPVQEPLGRRLVLEHRREVVVLAPCRQEHEQEPGLGPELELELAFRKKEQVQEPGLGLGPELELELAFRKQEQVQELL